MNICRRIYSLLKYTIRNLTHFIHTNSMHYKGLSNNRKFAVYYNYNLFGDNFT